MENKPTVIDCLFRPFKYIAGAKALILGLCIMTLLSILGYLGNAHFNGVVGIQYGLPGQSQIFAIHVCYQIVAFVTMAVIFYVTARIVSKSSVRLIDIAGTMSLSQAPYILLGLIGLLPAVHLDLGENKTMINVAEITSFLADNAGVLIVLTFLVIIIMAWSIALKYNAYSVSGNIKGVVGGVSFAIALVLSEVLSKVIIFIIVPYLY